MMLLVLGFELFAAVLLPLVPALVALYFLKLRRERVVVSSTFLWKRSVEDLRVNAPFQKLRRSLLLLLQLLALAALILAASKPVWRGTAAGGRSLLVLVDNSASMNAREEGRTRLEAARKEARAIAEGLLGGDQMALVTFSSRSGVLRPLTSDRSALLQAIDGIPATSLPTDLVQALRTAAALAEGQPSVEIVVIGDGAYGNLTALPDELQRLPVRFVPVGKGTENLGIAELDVRRGFGSRRRLELFASVRNAGAVDRRVSLGVYRDDRLLAAAELQVPAGKTVSHTFDAGRILEGERGGAVLRLEVDPGGLLPDDDAARILVRPPSRLEVLVVGEENPFLDRVLAVQDHVDARRIPLGAYIDLARGGKLVAEKAKVIIFDRRAPGEPPDRPALYLGCHPPIPGIPGDRKKEAGAPGAGSPPELPVIQRPVIVDWDRNHPVNRFINYSADLAMEESLAFPAAPGYRSLVDAGARSILGTLSFPGEGRLPVAAILVGFDILKSNWPRLHSFPIFFGNALEWLGEAAGGEAAPRYRTGDVLTFHPGDRKVDSPAFRDPSGRDHPAATDRAGELSFASTEVPGIYELRSGGDALETYPVSLLSASETDIAPRAELRFGQRVVQPDAEVARTRDLWKWFALAALGIILIEWWVYWKRVV